MKNVLVILLLMLSASANAQQLISSSAKVSQGISWTVGEMVTETIIGSDFCSIQGFNHPQGRIAPVGVGVVESVNSINIYPNPVENELMIDGKEGDAYCWKLTNLLGQEITSGYSFVTGTTINMCAYSPGNYLLTVVSNQIFKSIIIIKK